MEAFGEAIDDIAKGAAPNPFPKKIPDAFTKALTPFVTQCLSILKDKAANPKRAPLQYMAALKDGILKDGKLPLVANRRETDHSLLARLCFCQSRPTPSVLNTRSISTVGPYVLSHRLGA